MWEEVFVLRSNKVDASRRGTKSLPRLPQAALIELDQIEIGANVFAPRTT
jgi:hypothetical protein